MNLEFEPAGALVTATLAASEIEGAGARAGADSASHGNCANCQLPLTGQFCHGCGQRAHVHRSLLHLGEEVLHGLLHFDAKAWRTLPLLVAQPGKLTRRYIDGQRTRFVSPLALFLFMVFFMFFVVSSVNRGSSSVDIPEGITNPTGSLDEQIAKARMKLAKAEAQLGVAQAKGEDVAEARADVEEARSDLKDVQEAQKLASSGGGKVAVAATRAASGKSINDSDLSVDTGMPAVDAAIKHAMNNPELTIYKLKNSASKFSFLLVPISLPFLWLMFFWKRGITMYDHAVFVLYSLSFMSLLVVSISLLKMAGLKSLVVWLIFLAPPLHMFLQLRGTYSLGFASTLWRTAALLCVSGMVFLLYLLLILMMSMA